MEEGAPQILIVEDEASLRRNLVALFEDQGFVVHAAGSGEEGLALVKEHPINVGIVDMRLPGIDGNEMIERALALRPAIRFLIHTGSITYGIPDSLRKLGIRPEHVFLKPLADVAILLEAARHAIATDGKHDA